MSLIGTLQDTKLADVLRLFAAGRKTGLLTVESEGHKAVLRFQKGTLVHASAGRLQGDTAVLDLFGWRDGQMTFLPEERRVVPNVDRGVDTLILEGVRMGELIHRTNELIPSDRLVFEMGPEPSDESARCTLGPAEWRVLRCLDGIRDVREVIEATKLPRSDVLRILVELTDAGFLQRVEVQKMLRVQAQGIFGKETAEVDTRVDENWRKASRFAGGVRLVEIRTLAGRTLALGVVPRPRLIRDISLPRTAMAELAAREGDEVSVRPIG
jgi:Domain of unknown function (DUF4388)